MLTADLSASPVFGIDEDSCRSIGGEHGKPAPTGIWRGSKCRVYSSDMKVYISETRYFHPDVIVTCDPRDRGTVQAIRSPRLVVEVLSPSTELIDRTWKLKNYCAHPTIEEYILVDSQSLKIEIYHKEQNKWIYEAFEDSEEITLNSIGVSFTLADAYTDVEFDETTGED